jgi:hypothetical protein
MRWVVIRLCNGPPHTWFTDSFQLQHLSDPPQRYQASIEGKYADGYVMGVRAVHGWVWDGCGNNGAGLSHSEEGDEG